MWDHSHSCSHSASDLHGKTSCAPTTPPALASARHPSVQAAGMAPFSKGPTRSTARFTRHRASTTTLPGRGRTCPSTALEVVCSGCGTLTPASMIRGPCLPRHSDECSSFALSLTQRLSHPHARGLAPKGVSATTGPTPAAQQHRCPSRVNVRGVYYYGPSTTRLRRVQING